MKRLNPKLSPIAQLGDLITITGYATRLFRIDSYTHEFTYERGLETEEIYYDCSCVTSAEYTLAAQEDITVACAEVYSEIYLETYEHPIIDVVASDIFANLFANMNWEAEVMTKPVKAVNKTKEPTKQERIDALLDEMNNVNNAIELIGDSDGEYGRRIDEIKAELEAVSV